MSFSWKDRQVAIASLGAEPPELLVIGGGVVGASLAAHAARLGLDALLLEKEDFAYGASGNSTGLAHAGLRYLAQGRVGYVFREGRERNRLQDLAPQWVRPFNFILPAYKGDPYPFWMMRFGTGLYDLLGWFDALLTKRSLVLRHRVLSAEEVKQRIPGIRSEGLLGGIEYFVDARLQDTRFTMGYAQQAFQYGARLITHCEVTGINLSDQLPRIEALDHMTGELLKVTVPLIINATGAWIDGLRSQVGMERTVVQRSKGIHLIVDHLVDSPLIMSGPVRDKVFFVIPIDGERTLVGTTDTPAFEDPDEIGPTDADVTELLQQVFHFFPYLKHGGNLQEAMEAYKQVHVRDVYWGIRPLLAQGGSTLHASREHKLVKDRPNFWSLPGVKLTAARAAGHEAAIEAWQMLRKWVAIPSVTWDSLPGGELWDYQKFVQEAQKRFKVGPNSEAIVRYLISMYGTRYVEVLQWAHKEPHFSDPVISGEPWILAEAAYAAHEEMVLTLNDFLWRRTKWAHYRDLPPESVKRIAETLAQFLDWKSERIAKELEEFAKEQKRHRLS